MSVINALNILKNALSLVFLFVAFNSTAQKNSEKAAVTSTILPYAAQKICLDNTVAVSPPVWAPRNMVVRDFDGDLFDDVVLYDTTTKFLTIYKNQNATSFVPVQVAQFANVRRFTSVAAGDFDGDGDLDIAVCVPDTVKLLANLGGMNFSLVYDHPFNAGGVCSPPYYIQAGKLNGDNTDDIGILTGRVAASGVHVIAARCIPQSPNTFSLASDYTTNIPNGPNIGIRDTISISIGNWDPTNGPLADIMISNKNVNNLLHVLKNVSAGALSFSVMPVNTASLVPVGQPTINIIKTIAIDASGDGVEDIFALSRAFTSSITALYGFAYFNGAVNAATISNFALPTGPTFYHLVSISPLADMPVDFTVGDINGDGFKDFIGINNTALMIYPFDPNASNPNQPFTATISIPIALPSGVSPEEVALGHWDKNGIPDIFFKPWKKIIANTTPAGLIPNFSYSIHASGDSVVCPGKIAFANLVLFPNPTTIPQHSVDWYQAPGGYVSSGPSITINNPGHYYPNLNITMPFSQANCNIKLTGKDTLIVNPKPIPTLTVSIANQSVCLTGTTIATASSSAGVTYTWFAPGGASVTAGPSLTTAPVFTPTTYSVVVEDTDGCQNSKTITVYNYSQVPVPITWNKNPICPGDSAILSASGASLYLWTSPTNTFLSTSSSILVKPAATTDYTLFVVDMNGCPSFTNVIMNIDQFCDIKIYNGVTLNGDGNNDKWVIDNIERFRSNQVSIFNRWGTRIFHKNGYNNKDIAWPDDNNLPASTYYYVIDRGDGSALLKGWIELIKN